MKYWLLIAFLAAAAHADPEKISMPSQPPTETAHAETPAVSAEPISTTTTDEKDKKWKDYSNRIVKVRLRVNAAWPVVEMKESQTTGSVSFTLAHAPGIVVTFGVIRSPMQGSSFDAWISSASLTPLYPSGYKLSHTTLAGRKAALIRGTASDGRYDESYFVAHGDFISQVSSSAPKETWKQYQPALAALKESLQWLP